MARDGIGELAKLFIERDNPQIFEITTAKVTQINPLQLKTPDELILSKEYENVVFSASILKDYSRTFVLENVAGKTNSVNDGGDNANSHEHDIINLSGTIKFTDEFKVGDEFIVIPLQSGLTWYVMDKVVRI